MSDSSEYLTTEFIRLKLLKYRIGVERTLYSIPLYFPHLFLEGICGKECGEIQHSR